MKPLLIGLLTSFLLSISLVSFSQKKEVTKEQRHANLSKYHNKAIQRTSAILDSQSDDNNYNKENAEWARQDLENARLEQEELKFSMPDNYQIKARPYHEAIQKHHSTAKKHNEALRNELVNDKPDKKKVRQLATDFNNSIDNAEIQNQKLIEETSY